MRAAAISILCVLALCLGLSATRADVPLKVQKQLKGQIFVSPEPLPQSADSDDALVKALKKANRPEIKHTSVDGVPVWRFHVLAFMSRKPGVSQVALDFYTDDKTKAFVAQERLAGIDKGLTLLVAQVDLSEDDGLSPNKSYVVKLTAEVGGKEVVLATTKLRTR
ncbi:MAG TPA: hypothetical protein VFU21_24360 [Kofleriaceae bacterium]|nr:hypothetical protein [Kofleriaceae bacterium]